MKSCFVTNISTIQLFSYATVLLALAVNLTLPTHAFEDYIITTKGRLTNISIEDNSILNVYPLITIMNNKNTLMVTPLKTGKTSFSVLKNNKDKITFNLEITDDKTTVEKVDGFEILSLDIPEVNEFELDKPPVYKEVK